MNDAECAIMAEAAVEAENALGNQQWIFGFGKFLSDQFSSNSYQKSAEWRKHFDWIVYAIAYAGAHASDDKSHEQFINGLYDVSL